MTVKEIIAEGLRIIGVKNEKEIDERVKEALTTVGLVAEHASRYPHEFSGGQRQRIGIARALVVEPSFIIADEPISALDVSIRAQVINLLNELREEKGITIMFIAHDLSVVKYFSDRLAVMYFGKIVEIGDKEKIFNNPLHPYTLSLMASIPLPDPLYEQQRGKTERYNPGQAHDYSKEAPILREIEPDHFVLCNTEEFNRYKAQTKA
jgi:ABC-type oligopeptide transport system ATPase subunit